MFHNKIQTYIHYTTTQTPLEPHITRTQGHRTGLVPVKMTVRYKNVTGYMVKHVERNLTVLSEYGLSHT